MLTARDRLLFASFVVGLTCAGCLIDGGPFEDAGAGGAQGPGGSTTTTGTGGSATTSTSTGTNGCTNAECDDGNPCTVDGCPSGTCEHALVSDGTPLEDLDLNDCLAPVCVGGVEVQEVDQSQSPDLDPLDCVVADCLATGRIQTVVKTDGELCGDPPTDQCKKRACSSGACLLEDLPDGTVIDPGDTNVPNNGSDCRDLVCQNGSPKHVPNILNCQDLGPTNCYAPDCTPRGQCKADAGLAILAPAGYPCDSDGDGSLDGECDGMGGDENNCK
jgi:hypothetical protein